MKPNQVQQEAVQGQVSWKVATKDVEAFVTRQGGHLGPVTFDRRGRKIQPYSIAPWAEEKPDASLPPILRVLRGDFFCMPFGGNSEPYRGEKHPVHGETANNPWHFESLESEDGYLNLRLSMETTVRRGRVEKQIGLAEGHNAVYCRHTISGMSGPMNFGHHAMIKFPESPGSGLVSTSSLLRAQVYPGAFEDAACYGYSCLKPGAEFNTLRSVALATGGVTNLIEYPARRGYEDLVMLTHDLNVPFAWTAVTFPKERYAWFALKNPRILRHTVLWLSNGGRHYPPWSGRHTAVMGIEDVMSYFHEGLAASAGKNPLSTLGIPTHHVLDPERATVVPYIMVATPIPSNFDRIMEIEPCGNGTEVQLVAATRKRFRVSVNTDFLKGT